MLHQPEASPSYATPARGPVPLPPRPRPPRRANKLVVIVVLVLAAVVAVAVAVGVAVGFLTDIPLYNDSDESSQLEVGDQKVTLAPHAWKTIQLRDAKSYEAKATLTGGRVEKWKIDLTRRPSRPDVHAYALAGSGCFALLDVLSVYKDGGRPIRVLGTFKATHVLEQQLSYATVLPAGDLPKEAIYNRQYDTLAWLKAVPCAEVADAAAIKRYEAQLNATMRKK